MYADPETIERHKQTIDQAIIDAIPRHPADPNVAYGYNLDPEIIKTLLEKRILVAAIFRGYCSKEELANNIKINTDSDQESQRLTVMRITAFYRKEGVDLENDAELLNTKFSEHGWLKDKMRSMSFWPQKKLGEFGFHVLHAFKNAVGHGLTPDWHKHNDITAHLTVAGAGLEWLPGDIDERDANKNPQKYESRVQTVDIGDLIVMGSLPHRSSKKIKALGQFAIIGGGPLTSELEY